MATWKKIITSGSAAELSSLTLDTQLPVAQGGTGATTLTDGGILLGSGTGAITAMTALGNGEMIVGDGTTDPVAESGATLRTSIGVGTGDSPQFTDLTLTGGDITLTGAATDIDLIDNNTSALSFDASGKTGILEIVTTDNAEQVKMSGDLDVAGIISGSTISGSFVGDGSNLTGVAQDIDTLSAFSGVPHATDDEFLISDDGTEKRATMTMVANGAFALVSGNATIAAGGALSLADNSVGNDEMADNAIGNAELKQDDDITLQSLTTTNNVTVGGDLTVNGTTTTVATTNLDVKDQFILLASGSSGANVDAGILVQSGSVPGTGSAFYHDKTDERWSVGKSLDANRTAATTPTQFVTTVKTEAVNPSSDSGSYGAGEMHVNTTTGEIWIRFG